MYRLSEMIEGVMVKGSDIVRIHDEQAAKYDQQVREYKWFGHEVL